MSRRAYVDPWTRTDIGPREPDPNTCADCGRRITPDWTRCRPCDQMHVRATAPPPEPWTESRGWSCCNGCGGLRGRHFHDCLRDGMRP